MKKVVITGATSFLGAATVEKFLCDGYEVYAIVRRNSHNIYRLEKFKNIKIVELNLDEIEYLTGFLDNADVFLHFAWDTSSANGRNDPVTQENNYKNAMSAVKVAEKLGCKLFVFPGSQAEYGKHFDMTSEDSVCTPVSEYGKAKLRFGTDANNMLKNSNMHFLHLRIYSVFGENDRPGTLIESCMNTFQNGGCIELGECSHLWNYLYIDDFANILSKFVRRHFEIGDLQNLYNIGGCETKPLKEFIIDLYNKSRKKGGYKFGVRPENAEGSPWLYPNLSKLKQIINLESLITFEDGVEKMLTNKFKKKCIVCGRELGNNPLISFDKMPASAQNIPLKEELENDKPFQLNLFQCDGCGLVQFDCEPVNYYKDVIRSGGFTTTMDELRSSQYKHLIETYNLQGKSFLEVGCGQGEFINVLTRFPVEVYGIENKADLVELAKNKGLNVEQGFITDEKIQNNPRKYDVFLSFNFLEHQPDPNGMLQAIYNKLTDDGMGLITVPSFEYILKYDGYYELIRDHIANYTFDSLRVLVEKNGFEILEQDIINRDTLSIIVRKRKKIDLSHWNNSFRTLKKEFEDFINKSLKENEKIAVWGASHQGFTILASLEIGKYLEYIVDSAPFKQGRYSPASQVKIVSPKEFYSDPTDNIIILAPGYTDEIKNSVLSHCGDKVKIYALRSDHIEKLA